MTLFKQIVLLLGIIQILILGSVMYQNFKISNNFIKNELHQAAEHTAVSLGLSIASVANEDDLVIIDTMLNSVFDSGYYESIVLKDINNNVLIKKEQKIKVSDIPSWFINFINFKAPVASSQIVIGWVRFGVIEVKNNSGLAYKQLWDTFKDISLSFMIFSIIGLIVLYVLLNFLLKPLEKIRKQAEAILGQRFIIQEKLPSTTELQKVVKAMNSMIAKVKQIYENSTQAINKNTALLYEDEETKLANRRFFMLKLDECLHTNELSSGSIVILNIKNLKDYKDKVGYKKGLFFIKNISELLIHEFSNNSNVVSRLNDNEFALLLPTYDLQYTKTLCDKFDNKIKTALLKNELKELCSVDFGIASYNSNLEVKKILSSADYALSKAQNSDLSIFVLDKDEDLSLGKDEWREFIQNAIMNDDFGFEVQYALNDENTIIHAELFLRIKDKDNNILAASSFMPIINSLKMNIELDFYVLRKVKMLFKENKMPDIPIAINLSSEIFSNLEHKKKLNTALKELKEYARNKIYLEFSTRMINDDFIVEEIAYFLKNLGFGFGLDNVLLDSKTLNLLKQAHPGYIKVLRNYLIDFLKDYEYPKQFLDIINKTFEINIIALGIEDKKDIKKLILANIHSFQGRAIENTYYIGFKNE